MTGVSCSKAARTYFPVRAGLVPVFAGQSLPLYLRDESTGQYLLYRSGNTTVRQSDLQRLAEAGIATVYIEKSEYARFQCFLRSSIERLAQDEKVPVSRRLGMVNEVVRDTLRDAFRWGNVDRAVQVTDQLTEHVVALMDRDDFIASELGSVLHFDYGTFTHSANVGMYSILLARQLGHTNRDVLKRIGTGALLHDIGKCDLTSGLINKPAALTPEEMELVRSHSCLSLLKLRKLKDSKQLDFGQLMMAYQHHERLDGSGYPVHSEGDEIHEWARICAIADVYEALTSDRPHRRAYSKAGAMAFMQSMAGRLDREMLRCWTMTIDTN
jgi:putative nucleotidyltransferase with HDIG domain